MANERSDSVGVLYLAPLKALLNNLEKRGEDYATACRLNAFKWHGDVSGVAKRKRTMGEPPDLLMTTPESIEAMLIGRRPWRRLFRGLSTIIIDEAHNFAAGERGAHLLSLMERLEVATEARPQRIAMTATIGNPEGMSRWLSGAHREPARRVTVVGDAPIRDYRVRIFDDALDDDETPDEDRASVRWVRATAGLVTGKRCIVFVKSRRQAEQLSRAIGYEAHVRRIPLVLRTHHSSVSAAYREDGERLIQVAGESGLNALISTSTLELGVDIGELDAVVETSGLASPSSFLQRVGRTGRRPGRPQRFRGLVRDRDALVLQTATIRLGMRGDVEALLFPRRTFHVLAHQLLCLAIQSGGFAPDAAWAVFSQQDCFSGIERDEFDALVRHMVSEDYLHRAEPVLGFGAEAERAFGGTTWRRLFAVFDGAALYEVHSSKGHIGTLDAGFAESLVPPCLFMLGGRPWIAECIIPKSRLLRVRPAPSQAGAVAPVWQSMGGPAVSRETAQEVGILLHGSEVPEFLDEQAAAALEAARAARAVDAWAPGDITCETHGHNLVLATYAGDRINQTLARLLTIAGVGEATSNFERVAIKAASDPSTAVEIICGTLADLRDGDWSTPGALLDTLSARQKPWAFSPFARCLPEHLLIAALLERSTDPEGLIDLARGADL